MSRLRSFGPALRGVWVARTGANFKIQLAGAAAVAVLAAAYGLRRTHLALVIDDLHALGRDDRIRDTQDSPPGVLVVCAAAAVVGVLVFLPL